MLGLLALVYLFSLAVSYWFNRSLTNPAFYAGFLMFVQLMIMVCAKWILRWGNYYVLQISQILVTVLMAFIMQNPTGSFSLLIGTIPVLVIEDIPLGGFHGRFLISEVIWVYAIGILVIGALTEPLLSVFYLLEAIVAVALLTYYYYKPVYENNYKTLQLQQMNSELDFAYQKVEQLTVAEERQKVARDLHDTLTQDLVGISMELAIMDGYAANDQPDKVIEQLHHVQQLTTQSIKESRAMIDDYRNVTPENATVGLRLRILEQTALIQAKYGLTTKVAISEDIVLSGELLVDVVRMVTEALMNVVKHAEISEAKVSAVQKGRDLIISVENHGKPFPEKAKTPAGHYGLKGMRERAQHHGGDIQILSLPDTGTVVRIKVKMEAKS